jgi:hypothetical protein
MLTNRQSINQMSMKMYKSENKQTSGNSTTTQTSETNLSAIKTKSDDNEQATQIGTKSESKYQQAPTHNSEHDIVIASKPEDDAPQCGNTAFHIYNSFILFR